MSEILHEYSEDRNGDTYCVVVSKIEENRATVVIRINGIQVFNRKYTISSFNLVNFFHKEVGKIHLGFYDGYIKKDEKKNDR